VSQLSFLAHLVTDPFGTNVHALLDPSVKVLQAVNLSAADAIALTS
jgi:hypothetical protein